VGNKDRDLGRRGITISEFKNWRRKRSLVVRCCQGESDEYLNPSRGPDDLRVERGNESETMPEQSLVLMERRDRSGSAIEHLLHRWKLRCWLVKMRWIEWRQEARLRWYQER
jgi:hypothetical protein